MTEKIIVSIIVIGITHGIIGNKNEKYNDVNIIYSFKDDKIRNEFKNLGKNIFDEISRDGISARFRHVQTAGNEGYIKGINSNVNVKSFENHKIYKKPFIKNDKDYLFKSSVNNLQKINLRNTNYVKRYFTKYNKQYFT